MTPNIISRARNNYRHHLLLRSLLGRLWRLGIQISPYYLTQESFNREINAELAPGVGPVRVNILSPEELEELYDELESKGLAMGRATVQRQPYSCFALRLNEEIVACSWFSLHQCLSRYSNFTLKEDEAYLCNAFTLNSCRGKNLAPYLRYELYKYLNSLGRTNLYSITEFFNTPALKFKEKLGARHTRLGLYIGLFGRWQWNLTLKRFRN